MCMHLIEEEIDNFTILETLTAIFQQFIEQREKNVVKTLVIWNRYQLPWSYRQLIILHPETWDHTFFSSVHGMFRKIDDHMLGHVSSLIKFKGLN